MPLVWTHAEFLKLLVARREGDRSSFSTPCSERYGSGTPAAKYTRWRNETPVPTLAIGRALLIEDRHAFTLHLGWDGWQSVGDVNAEPLPFGLWGVVVSADRGKGHAELNFTRRFGEEWEGHDHAVAIGQAKAAKTLVHMHDTPPGLAVDAQPRVHRAGGRSRASAP